MAQPPQFRRVARWKCFWLGQIVLFRVSSKSAIYDTTLLRALAILLITNSHLDRYYPQGWSWMASDGFLGNVLFFAVSGYSLALANKRSQRGFLTWYSRRVLRIYPAVWIVTIASLTISAHWQTWRPIDYLTALTWPTRYSFLSYLMVYYVLFYPVMRLERSNAYVWLSVALLIPLAALYANDVRTLPADAHLALGDQRAQMSILYFEFVLLGGWLAQRPPSAVRHPAVDALIAVGLFAVYIFAKYLMVVVGRHACWYGLIYVLVFTITFYMFRVSWSHMADVILRRCGVVSLLISCLATMTLEIYVVQNVILDVPALQNATFPLNICLFGLVVLVLSTLVFLISTQVRQRVERYIGGSSGPRQSGVQKEPVANHAST